MGKGIHSDLGLIANSGFRTPLILGRRKGIHNFPYFYFLIRGGGEGGGSSKLGQILYLRSFLKASLNIFSAYITLILYFL